MKTPQKADRVKDLTGLKRDMLKLRKVTGIEKDAVKDVLNRASEIEKKIKADPTVLPQDVLRITEDFGKIALFAADDTSFVAGVQAVDAIIDILRMI